MASAPLESIPEQACRQLPPHPAAFKYSRRVPLKFILAGDDIGSGLIDERIIVGGWVRSCRRPAQQESPPFPGHPTAAGDDAGCGGSCCDVLLAHLPGIRHLAEIISSSSPATAKKKKRPRVEVEERVKLNEHRPSPTYLSINDGSCLRSLQIMLDPSMSIIASVLSPGASILVHGILERFNSPGKNLVQLKVEKVLHIGIADPDKYPLGKRTLSLESLRPYPHLRPRTSAVAAIARVSNGLSQLTHKFFQNNGFLFVHLPAVTTDSKNISHISSSSKSVSMEKSSTLNFQEPISLETVNDAIKGKRSRIEELKRSESNKESLTMAIRDLQKANVLALHLEAQNKQTKESTNALNLSKGFTSLPDYPSISNQLHIESYACSLGNVYTTRPVFQPENHRTTENCANTWLIDAELVFTELEDVMNCAEDFVKFICKSVIDDYTEELQYLSLKIDKNCIGRLQTVISLPFIRITYTEALDALEKTPHGTFKNELKWGLGLSDEQERFLADDVYKHPIIIYEFPREAKPFYVRSRDDGKTVSAFDVIVPMAGAMARGSQKEERIHAISSRIDELGLSGEDYERYLDLRRHGTVIHSGFRIEFDKIVMLVTGLKDIRDVSFPNMCLNELM